MRIYKFELTFNIQQLTEMNIVIYDKLNINSILKITETGLYLNEWHNK